jgi:hypothetical protein
LLEAQVMSHLMRCGPNEAWRDIIGRALEINSKPLEGHTAASEVIKRDREIGDLDHFLSTAGWDLWQTFGLSVERTSARLIQWWGQPYSAKAVLILDGLSLRELPWLLQGATAHGFSVNKVVATASELPGETNEFAQALGFVSRSQLQNNGAGNAHSLVPARTESVDLNWHDCAALIDSSPNWVFWHHWPDVKVHSGAGAGQGLDTLTIDVANQLTSEEFWEFVGRLATGRRLVITSDHGYAATGLFFDALDEQANFLKGIFKSGRSSKGGGETGPFVPPVAMQLDSSHGTYLMAVGRRKWRSQGGYPTLAHGGLSLLEVLSPFVSLTK